MSQDINLDLESEGFYDKFNDTHYASFDEYFSKIENDVNQETDEDKNFIALFLGDEASYSYSSLKGLFLKHSESAETFEEWIEKQEYETYESIEAYLSGITEHDFVNRQICEEEPIGFVTCIHEEMTDAYADYKRGYEEWLYVFEEDYSETGRKKPRKTDREYFGVSICRYNWGDHGEYTGFQPYELKTRRITVKEWKKV
jgi:hypothetical protein